MMNSLLPPNATRFERALEAGAARIVDVASPPDLDDPMTCPTELLPWLAWGLSVDTWDADWSEQDKRVAVATSIALHRHKGTRLGGRLTLRPLYLRLGNQTVRLTGSTDDSGGVQPGAVIGTALVAPFFTGKSAVIPEGSSLQSYVAKTVVVGD